MENWLCESLRLTALWSDMEDHSALLPWHVVTGVEPEKRVDQKRELKVVETGRIWDGSAFLEMRSSPGRVDWLLSSAASGEELINQFQALGPVKENVEKFDELLFSAVAENYSALRFAIGLVALSPRKDKAAAYDHLQELIGPIGNGLDGASDFTYQINRPRVSLTPGLENFQINRLSRWSAASSVGMRFAIPVVGDDGVVSGRQVVGANAPMYATRVEFDLNTPANNATPIPVEARVGVLREMTRFGIEILAKGDVK